MSKGMFMLPQERLRYIADQIRSFASISAIDLARSLHVSTETIRRDLILLEKKGVLTRVYGGAVTLSRHLSAGPVYLQQRREINASAKQVIGTIAATMVLPGQVVFIDVGTTAQQVAVALSVDFEGTVVTNSLLVAQEFAESSKAKVLLASGRLRPREWSVVGGSTCEFLNTMYPDVAFLSSEGVDATAGFTDHDPEAVSVKRVVARNSGRAYVIADSSKHGKVGRFAFCTWHDVRGLITDTAPPEGLKLAIQASGGEVHLPSAPSTP